jgi:hypothetical protein
MKPGTRPLGRVNPQAKFNNYAEYLNVQVNLLNDPFQELESQDRVFFNFDDSIRVFFPSAN